MTLVDQLLQSPQLFDFVRQINNAVEIERAKRQKFFEDLREDEKAEFINGEVFVQSPVGYAHSRVSDALYLLLAAFNTRHPMGDVAHEKRLIHLSRNDYEPDICFWNRVKAATFTANQMRFPAPDFIAEVLSPSTEAHDRGVKLE
ncbi:MAG: Uma2 family endonuclease, partial [Tepidisphaeraceae bacterium]